MNSDAQELLKKLTNPNNNEDIENGLDAVQISRAELDKLINISKPLVGKTCSRKTQYMQYLEGVCRRNYYTMFALYHLSEPRLVWFGGAALDISRQMIEDMISIEWMELKNPEKQAKKLLKFENVERYTNLIQSRRLGVKPEEHLDSTQIKEINSQFELVKPLFSDKNGKMFHNYNHQSVETMIEDIKYKIDPQILTKNDLEIIIYWYLEGNKKNHFNADDIQWYLATESLRDVHLVHALERSIFIATNTFSQLALRYIDEMIKNDGGISDIKNIRGEIIELNNIK